MKKFIRQIYSTCIFKSTSYSIYATVCGTRPQNNLLPYVSCWTFNSYSLSAMRLKVFKNITASQKCIS